MANDCGQKPLAPTVSPTSGRAMSPQMEAKLRAIGRLPVCRCGTHYAWHCIEVPRCGVKEYRDD